MKKVHLCTLVLAGALGGVMGSAHAKLPPLSPEAKMKAEEAKLKTAWSDKVAAYQLCKAQDRAAASYQKTAKAAGKDVKPAAAAPACADPGPFVPPPAEAAATQPPPTATAATPPSGTQTAAQQSGAAPVKK